MLKPNLIQELSGLQSSLGATSVQGRKFRLYLVALVGQQGHCGGHEVLADAVQHHAHCFYQLLYAATCLHADLMIAV